MKLDKIILDCGLADMNGQKLSDEALAIIIDNAEAFLRAGGVITWDMWSSMSDETKAAFLTAGQRIRVETCYLTGLCAQNIDSALEVFSKLDGGDAKVRMFLEAAVNRAIRKFQEGAKE